MHYEQYVRAFAADVPHVITNVEPLLTRLRNEGIRAFCKGMAEVKKVVLEQLASDKRPLDWTFLPFIPRGVVSPDAPGHRLIDFVCVFDKLLLVGKTRTGDGPVADWDGFLQRSREAENFAGCRWEDVLPGYGPRVRSWILSQLGPVPSILTGCKHGPGATAERLRGPDKYLAVLSSQKSLVNPYAQTYTEKDLAYVGKKPSAIRMTDVPKDFSKRRLIGIEPTLAQFLQQGVAHRLRTSTFWKRYMLSLDDIRPHVRAAACHWTTTIDLSDASDRIPCSLVEFLLGPRWYELLASVSSGYATLPDGREIRLGMMATMGNGFCFELETLVFHLVTAALIAYGRGGYYDSRHYFEEALQQVSVFGDDIVAPRYQLPAILDGFLKCGFRPNDRKTCFGPFKETCGYWIDGSDGLVVRRRFTPSLTGKDGKLMFSCDAARVDLAAHAYSSGYQTLAVELMAPLANAPVRWNKKLQRLEARLSVLVDRTRKANVSDEIRHFAYWKTGNSVGLDEPTGQKVQKLSWVPMAPNSVVHQFLMHGFV